MRGAAIPCLLVCVGWLAVPAAATHAGMLLARSSMSALPDLPASDANAGSVVFSRRLLGVGYQAQDERWHAQLGDYLTGDPALALEYATLLNDTFGIAARGDFRSDRSETQVSSVLAPERNLRVRFAAGALREFGNCDTSGGCAPTAQSSVLLGIRKILGPRYPLSAFGVSVFRIADETAHAAHAAANVSDEPVLAGMRGYLLDLTLHPSERGAIELRRGQSMLTYLRPSAGPAYADPVIGSIAYSYRLAGCVRMQGRYGAGADAERFDVGLAGGRWSLSLERRSEEDGPSLQARYTIPLGASGGTRCGANDGAPSFAPLVEAVARRNAPLLRTPLSALDDGGFDASWASN